MASTFTIQGELSRPGLEAARDQLNALLDELLRDQGAETANGNAQLDRKVRALHERMGKTTWKFIYGCAEKLQTVEEVTFDDLAQVFGVNVGTVKSWHRSASKSINRVQAKFGGPPVLEDRWDGQRQHYGMPPETRAAILALGREHEEN